MASSMGFTEYLSDNSKKYTPLSGIIQGVGEIVGAVSIKYLRVEKKHV